MRRVRGIRVSYGGEGVFLDGGGLVAWLRRGRGSIRHKVGGKGRSWRTGGQGCMTSTQPPRPRMDEICTDVTGWCERVRYEMGGGVEDLELVGRQQPGYGSSSLSRSWRCRIVDWR